MIDLAEEENWEEWGPQLPSLALLPVDLASVKSSYKYAMDDHEDVLGSIILFVSNSLIPVVRPSVCPSVCLSVCLSARITFWPKGPYWGCSLPAQRPSAAARKKRPIGELNFLVYEYRHLYK